MSGPLFAAIEAGGTKMLCGIADAQGNFLMHRRVATTSPDETFAQMDTAFDHDPALRARVVGAGIGSFGPVDLDRSSRHFGHLTTTPKPGWSGVDIAGRVAAMLRVPSAIDTDVNCAALAEGMAGAAQGLDRFCYITIGTGIGVGVITDGRPDTAFGHAEAGHVRVPRAHGDDFAGMCPYHGDCAEGLACGPAMQARWGMPASELPDDHRGWDFAAHYLAEVCATLTYCLRPQRIIMGGGVLARASLYPQVRRAYETRMAGYALNPWSMDADRYITAPMLHTPSPGLIGALALARQFDRA